MQHAACSMQHAGSTSAYLQPRCDKALCAASSAASREPRAALRASSESHAGEHHDSGAVSDHALCRADFSSMVPLGDKIYMVNHFEAQDPGHTYFSVIEQNKYTGKLTMKHTECARPARSQRAAVVPLLPLRACAAIAARGAQPYTHCARQNNCLIAIKAQCTCCASTCNVPGPACPLNRLLPLTMWCTAGTWTGPSMAASPRPALAPSRHGRRARMLGCLSVL
jgi:hypothetical protein